MFRSTPPRPLRRTVGNTVGLTTRFSGSYPMNVPDMVAPWPKPEPETRISKPETRNLRPECLRPSLDLERACICVRLCCPSRRPCGIPHSGLRRGFRWLSHRKSVTLSIGTPLCPYPIAYRRAYGYRLDGRVLKNLRSPLCGINLWRQSRFALFGRGPAGCI